MRHMQKRGRITINQRLRQQQQQQQQHSLIA
jgi:hypothetical protein